jgi:large subunit ribosomal protein L7/L12
MATRIEAMKKQRAQLDARIKKAEATAKTKARKRDTQRKILVGHYFIEQAKKDGTYSQLCQTMLDYLTRESDKKCFQET